MRDESGEREEGKRTEGDKEKETAVVREEIADDGDGNARMRWEGREQKKERAVTGERREKSKEKEREQNIG